MESSTLFFTLVVLCLVGTGLSVPVVAPLSPSEEAKVAEPEVPTKGDATGLTPNTPTLDAANNPKTTTGDLDTADTLLFGVGVPLPGVWAGGIAAPGYGFGGYGLGVGGYGYGLPYHHRWGGYGLYW